MMFIILNIMFLYPKKLRPSNILKENRNINAKCEQKWTYHQHRWITKEMDAFADSLAATVRCMADL